MGAKQYEHIKISRRCASVQLDLLHCIVFRECHFAFWTKMNTFMLMNLSVVCVGQDVRLMKKVWRAYSQSFALTKSNQLLHIAAVYFITLSTNSDVLLLCYCSLSAMNTKLWCFYELSCEGYLELAQGPVHSKTADCQCHRCLRCQKLLRERCL